MALGFIQAISAVRDSVFGVALVNETQPGQFTVGIVGTAWCVHASGYYLTASHVTQVSALRRYLVRRLGLGQLGAEIRPVAQVVAEYPEVDLAVLRVLAPATGGQHEPIPFNFDLVPDGTRVLTYGLPSVPVYANGTVVGPGGDLQTLAALLVPHANEGIVAGQVDVKVGHPPRVVRCYEFNVGFYQGESGGPIIALDPLGAIATMQNYREIETPSGKVPGPHRGFSLAASASDLGGLGVT